MHLANYLGLLHRAEGNLAQAFREVADHHAAEPDVYHVCQLLAQQAAGHVERLQPFVDRYGEDKPSQPDRLHSELFEAPRAGGLGLLRDLQDLYIMVSECDITWTMIGQAAQSVRDVDLLAVVQDCEHETATQLRWLRTRMKQAAPQALVVAD